MVTVAALVYREPSWLSFLLEGLAWAKNRTPFRTLIVGNDAEQDVVATGRLDVDWRNDPAEGLTRMGRIYRAWNAAVEAATTDLVVLINDDMYVSDYWLDELVKVKGIFKCIPTSALVESGRIPSAAPERVKNFGLTPGGFDAEGWREHAAGIRKAEVHNGRLYMPCLFERDVFLRLGGYPLGNPPGTTGDKQLFSQFAGLGYRHVECSGSVVYHVQTGAAGGYYPDV